MTSDKTTEAAVRIRGGGRIGVLGGDARQGYIARLLSERGASVSAYATPQLPSKDANDAAILGDITFCGSLAEAISRSRALVLPLPLSPDGVTLNCGTLEEHPRLCDIFELAADSGCELVLAGMVRPETARVAAQLGLRLTDYGALPELAIRNAVPTAEGAVAIAMRELETTVQGTGFAVVGYGRCGAAIARLLLAMGGVVYGAARSAADRARMYADTVIGCGLSELPRISEAVSVIFNTVPAEIFDSDMLSVLARGTVIIDIASAPGGVDTHFAAAHGIKVIHAPSLPGRYAPLTAAGIICDCIAPLL